MKHSSEKIRTIVKDNYSKVAENGDDYMGCGCEPGCCEPNPTRDNNAESKKLGYDDQQLNSVPDGANMGLGCGNPHEIANISKGETVLDLGSGAGFDAFIAVQSTGPEGKVIGIDMTPKMIALSRKHALKSGYNNVQFNLGQIEALPLGDEEVDVIISNCVINLSPEKDKVFSEALRVLKPGGRLAVSDIVLSAQLPEAILNSDRNYCACISGAVSVANLQTELEAAGFEEIEIRPKSESRTFIKDWLPDSKVEDYIVSAYISAKKPA